MKPKIPKHNQKLKIQKIKIQKFKNSKIQKYESSKIQKYKSKAIQVQNTSPKQFRCALIGLQVNCASCLSFTVMRNTFSIDQYFGNCVAYWFFPGRLSRLPALCVSPRDGSITITLHAGVISI